MVRRRDGQPQPPQPPSKEVEFPIYRGGENLTEAVGMNGVVGGHLSLTAQANEEHLSLSVVTMWYVTIARRQDT